MRAGRRLGSAFGEEAVADPWVSLDVFPGRVALEFFAELADEDAEVFRLLGGLRAPHVGEQDAVGEDLARIAREEEQQVEFLGCEVHGTAGDGNGVRAGVDEEIADFNGGIAGPLGSAAKMSAHTREELLNAEGLGDVIVSAGVECLYFGVFLIAHGEDEDGGVRFAADGAAEVNACHTGHHKVGDDEVGVPLLEEAESFFGIVGGADIVALGGEGGTQDAGDLNFIVNDEDAFCHPATPGYDRLS